MNSIQDFHYLAAVADHLHFGMAAEPLAKDGLRHTPESCRVCFCKTECLREAVKGPDGIKVEEERVKRAYSSGSISFFERWSKKKSLERQKKGGSKT